MKDTTPRKTITQGHRILRKQLADCLKYIRRSSKYGSRRQEVELFLGTHCTNFDTISLQHLIQEYSSYGADKVLIRGFSSEDYDGYSEGNIEVYTYRKQTDEEYFDDVCQCLSPTKYQQEQYQDYLRLKKQSIVTGKQIGRAHV